MYLPGPSKGYQLVPERCQFTIPLGFTWHPFKDAGICIYSNTHRLHEGFNPKRCWHKNLVDGFFTKPIWKVCASQYWIISPSPPKKKVSNKKCLKFQHLEIHSAWLSRPHHHIPDLSQTSLNLPNPQWSRDTEIWSALTPEETKSKPAMTIVLTKMWHLSCRIHSLRLKCLFKFKKKKKGGSQREIDCYQDFLSQDVLFGSVLFQATAVSQHSEMIENCINILSCKKSPCFFAILNRLDVSWPGQTMCHEPDWSWNQQSVSCLAPSSTTINHSLAADEARKSFHLLRCAFLRKKKSKTYPNFLEKQINVDERPVPKFRGI